MWCGTDRVRESAISQQHSSQWPMAGQCRQHPSLTANRPSIAKCEQQRTRQVMPIGGKQTALGLFRARSIPLWPVAVYTVHTVHTQLIVSESASVSVVILCRTIMAENIKKSIHSDTARYRFSYQFSLLVIAVQCPLTLAFCGWSVCSWYCLTGRRCLHGYAK